MRYFASAIVALVLSTALPAISLAAASPPEVPPGVAVKARGDGWWFVDAKGFVLYTFDRDERTPDKSSCNADCAGTWPPLLAPADSKSVGSWSTIKREDGSQQWAFKGHPLYGYAAEGGPGTTFGDGEGDLWHVAYEPFWIPPGMIITNTLRGRVLADARGMTIYTFDRDKGGQSACSGSCLNDWIPVEAPFAASDHESWSSITRDDGSKQWAYQGKPLYRYVREAIATETAGDGVAKMWHAAVLQPAPSHYPAWVTVQGSDAGPLLADRHGKTIYTFNIYRKFGKPRMCGDEPCITSEWKPVLADAEAKAQDNWTIVANKDGTRQWAYHGMRLFTNDLDERPGDFWGIRFGGDRWWQTIMRSGLPMQGTDVGGGVGGQGGGR